MNIVVLQGTLSSEPVERTLASGVNVMNWDVVTATDLGRHTVPVQWNDPSRRVCEYSEGDEVVVLGLARRRFFVSGGRTEARTEVVAAEVAKPSQKVTVARILDRAIDALSS